MKKVNRFFKVLFLSGIFLLATGCGDINNGLDLPDPETSTETEITPTGGKPQGGSNPTLFSDPSIDVNIVNAYNKLGSVNKVFKANSLAARFFTGQIISNFMNHEVSFYGTLVEYNYLDDEILTYVDSLPQHNALLHQGYQNVTYTPGKKYVEFSSYTDTTTKEIVAHEVRILNGDFMDTFEKSFWYAKSVLFDPTMEIDLNMNYNLKTKEYLTGGIQSNGIQGIYKIANAYPDFFNLLGTINHVYVMVTQDDEIAKSVMNSESYYSMYYAEYSELKPEIQEYYENYKIEKKGYFNQTDFYIDPSMYYVEYQITYHNETANFQSLDGNIFKKEDFDNFEYGAPLPYIRHEYDLYDMVSVVSGGKYTELSAGKYPEELDKYGEQVSVKAYLYEDGTVVGTPYDDQTEMIEYIAEYTAFNDEVKTKYNAMKDEMFLPDHIGLYDFEKSTIEYKLYKNTATGKTSQIVCNFYAPDVKYVRGVGCWGPDYYDSFYDFLFDNPKVKYKENKAYPECLSDFGDLLKVYSLYDGDNIIKENEYEENGHAGYSIYYVAEYSTFDDTTKKYYEKNKDGFWERKSIMEAQKQYILYCKYYSRENDEYINNWDSIYIINGDLEQSANYSSMKSNSLNLNT